MLKAAARSLQTPDDKHALSPTELSALGRSQASTIADLKHQLEWFKRATQVRAPGNRASRNWLFTWTELGAEHLGIVQSLIVTCRLHQIDPYTYLVDVLQRVCQYPAAHAAELTPRLWIQRFTANPLRSDLSPAH